MSDLTSSPDLRLIGLDGLFAVCGLPAGSPIPAWALTGSFVSITRTPDEVSIVCPQANVPPGAQSELGWRCFQVPGPLDFALVGILARLIAPLAVVGVPVFALSTFDTDYLLIRHTDVNRALAAWAAADIDVDA
jgi:hypothetical protein